MLRAKMIALPFLLFESLPVYKIFIPWLYSMGGAYSITAVHMYVCPIRPVRPVYNKLFSFNIT